MKRTTLPGDVKAIAAVNPPSGTYFYPISPNSTGTSNTIGNGTCRVAPWMVGRTISIVRLGVDVSVVGEAGSKVRPVIYADNGSSFPGALIVDGGQLAGDAVGIPDATVSVTLTPGLYWIGAAVQAAPTTQPTVRTLGGHSPQALIGMGTSAPAANNQVVGYAGAMTGAAPSTFPTGNTGASSAPRLVVKTA